MLDLCLLSEIGHLLLCQVTGAFGLAKVVIVAVECELSIGKFDGLRRSGVEEITVVQNDDLDVGQAG